MRKCIRTAAALLLALALAAGLFGCSKLAPIVSGGDKPHTTEPAATGSQTDTEDTQNMENAEDTGEQDWTGEEESSDPAPVETDPPVWEGPETVVYLAPYDALAVEYGGYFYYVDRDDNLCRTTTDMTDYTLFCEAQIRGDVRIIGITDAGRMYLSSGGQSCYVDLAEGRDGMAADYGMVESQTFTGAALSIGIRALRGGWMYYTKSGENGLFRAKIGAVPEEENCIVFDKDIREAAVTGDYLIYTYNRGSRADLQVTLADDPDSLLLTIEGNGTYPTTMLAGTDDRSGTPLLLVSRYELIDRGAEYSVYDLSTLELATDSMLDSAKLQRLGYCFGKNGDEIVCFNSCLRFDPFGTFSDGSSQYYPNAYYTDDYLVSFFSITYAGNGWYFFADADQGGATHAIEEGGTELNRETRTDGVHGFENALSVAHWPGVMYLLEKRMQNSDAGSEILSRYSYAVNCPSCRGTRLRPEALCVKVDGVDIQQFCALSVTRALDWLKEREFKGRHAVVAGFRG